MKASPIFTKSYDLLHWLIPLTIKFPRQQHGVREPRLLRVLHVEETRWMEKYIRGTDWEPWVREEK